MTAPLPGREIHFATPELDRLEVALRAEHSEQQELLGALEHLASQLEGQTDADSVFAREVTEREIITCHTTLAEVQAALERIDDGRYGLCERCGAAISYVRLEAIPYARRCVSCPPLLRRI